MQIEHEFTLKEKAYCPRIALHIQISEMYTYMKCLIQVSSTEIRMSPHLKHFKHFQSQKFRHLKCLKHFRFVVSEKWPLLSSTYFLWHLLTSSSIIATKILFYAGKKINKFSNKFSFCRHKTKHCKRM